MVYECRKLHLEGTTLWVLRNGTVTGRLRALGIREHAFQAADILEGAPQPGDLVEPPRSPPESESGQQGQGGGFRP